MVNATAAGTVLLLTTIGFLALVFGCGTHRLLRLVGGTTDLGALDAACRKFGKSIDDPHVWWALKSEPGRTWVCVSDGDCCPIIQLDGGAGDFDELIERMIRHLEKTTC